MPSIDHCKCILVTGATSGIGRALALSIAKLASRPVVIATGRRLDRLEQLKNSSLETFQMDLDANKDQLKEAVERILRKYPELDAVIFCAGIQHEFFFKDETTSLRIDDITSEFNINYTSVVPMISYILPHFLRLGAKGRLCSFIPVTSGFALVPGPWVPNYSASNAALHSFALSLRVQLQGTNVDVMEIIPPLVESELHDPYGTTERLSKLWMPLDRYIKVTMEGLINGDAYITAGSSFDNFQRFGLKDKEKLARGLQESRQKW